jgi:hypothetical protein
MGRMLPMPMGNLVTSVRSDGPSCLLAIARPAARRLGVGALSMIFSVMVGCSNGDAAEPQQDHALGAGTPDAGPSCGVVPCGTPDGAAPLPDAGLDGGAGPDGAVPDAAFPDGAAPDAATPDASMPDASMPDAAMADGATPDAEAPDAATPDAGSADGGGGAKVTFTKLLATVSNLPFPLSSVSPSTHYFAPTTAKPGPNQRLYLYADYNMAGGPIGQQFTFLVFTLNRQGCGLDMAHDVKPDGLVTAPIVDMTSGVPVAVETVPFGGAGKLPGEHGVNVWDITDLPLINQKCAPTAGASLDLSTPGPSQLFVYWQYGGFGAVVRTFSLYAGEVTGP